MAKIKNAMVNIKIGKKEYCFKNLILNTLLENYALNLINHYNHFNYSKSLSHCLIKFSDFENINENSTIMNNEFDICILNTSTETVASKNKITNKYVCYTEDNYIYDYNKKTAQNIKISDYNGKKIHWLGFSATFSYAVKTLAVLDVSNYDIYIQDGEEIRITRIDEISTDAIFTSLHEKIKAPVHLYPNNIPGLLPAQTFTNGDLSTTIYNNSYAKLTNFGFGNTPENIELEYDIDGNYEVNENVFSIKNIWSPKGLYPSNDLYPSEDLYPDLKSFNYLILKFKLFQKVAEDDATYEDVINDRKLVIKDTGAQYLQAIPLEKRGNVDLKIKYERG